MERAARGRTWSEGAGAGAGAESGAGERSRRKEQWKEQEQETHSMQHEPMQPQEERREGLSCDSGGSLSLALP